MSKDPSGTLMFPVYPPFDTAYRHSSTATPVGPHCHDAVEIYYTLTPLPDVLLDNRVFEVPAGTLIIIPPFCVHQLYHEAGKMYERYILSINSRWFEAVTCGDTKSCSFLRQDSMPVLITPDARQSEALINSLKKLITIGSNTHPDALSVFFECLSSIEKISLRTHGLPMSQLHVSASQKRVNDIISYIHDHIYETLSVNELAAHFYLNPGYMSRIFKSHAHICLSRYILLQKITTAQTLLRDGFTVAQVQEKLGFSSYAYFFKTFQKTAGISPSRYRAEYAQM
ncbi:MAG: AraC family transcriptional regulator [Lachnospiraceae bacterium]|nr:AraC family transcriptional regulator [Lachnospiraceae bacterium]